MAVLVFRDHIPLVDAVACGRLNYETMAHHENHQKCRFKLNAVFIVNTDVEVET